MSSSLNITISCLLTFAVIPASDAKEGVFRHATHGGPARIQFVDDDDDDDWEDYWEDREEYFEDLQEEREEYYEELRERRKERWDDRDDFYKGRHHWSRHGGHHYGAPWVYPDYAHPRSRVKYRFYYAPPVPLRHYDHYSHPRYFW
jgi:hypothetical protein